MSCFALRNILLPLGFSLSYNFLIHIIETQFPILLLLGAEHNLPCYATTARRIDKQTFQRRADC